jgi:hypothetical protein
MNHSLVDAILSLYDSGEHDSSRIARILDTSEIYVDLTLDYHRPLS